MSSQNHPKWWQLYFTFPLLVILFAVDSRLKISTRGHQVVQVGIVLIIYAFFYIWMKANRSALSRMDQNQYRETFTVIEILPYQQPESDTIFDLPDTEIMGLLNDTYEMDYTDAESFNEKYRGN